MACVMSAPRSVSATPSGWRTRLKHALERKRATVVRGRGREVALFPGPHPASRRLQYGNAGEGMHGTFPHVSDVTDRANVGNM